MNTSSHKNYVWLVFCNKVSKELLISTFLGCFEHQAPPYEPHHPKKVNRFVEAVILSNFAEESMKKFPAVCEIKPKNGYF